MVRVGEVPAVRWLFPSLDGSVCPLVGERLVLGRGEECSVQLLGAELSRRHAELRRDGPLWLVEDLGSRNGTWLNGKRLAKAAAIGTGDLLRIGEWIGLVSALPPGAATAPAYRELQPGFFAGPTLLEALEPARKAASKNLPIVVEGQTGTGKELAARAIHGWSGRTGPFVGVNCAALPESLAEAELFGHHKGAFTGAHASRPGYFRAAHGGTLLLDEVTDLPLSVQAKLLRVLELREVVAVGGTTAAPVDVNIIAAAQEPLESAVAAGRFRADLCGRLQGLPVRLPPLRERVDEIPFLFARLLAWRAGGLHPAVEPAVVERLCLYDWPFNVRELDLLVRRLLAVHAQVATLGLSHLPEHIRPASEPAAAPKRAEKPPRAARRQSGADVRDEQHLQAFRAALRQSSGNVAQAARAVGISRQRAYRLMGAAAQDEEKIDE